jgi:phosphoserine phosphatase
MQKFKAVVFDVDGTLTDHNSWFAFTRDIGGSEAEHLALYQGQASGQIGLDETKQKLLSMWMGTGNANKHYIKQLYDSWPVRKEAFPLVDWLQNTGYAVCLITGSVRSYAEVIAKKLRVSEYYANADLYFDNEGELTGFHYDTDQASVKVDQLNNFCALHSIKPSDCIAVGDGNNDIGLFRITGNGILINTPDAAPTLKQAAWKTIDNLDEVRMLLENSKVG